MKVSLWFVAMLATSLVGQQSCSQETVSPVEEVTEVNCPEAGAFVKEVKSAKGIVWYSDQQQLYYVLVPTGSIDSNDIGFVCNLPEEYKQEGLKITFSGQYHQFNRNIGRFVGSTYYYLTLNQLTKTSTP